ncbi:MAG: YlxR family protein [Clostridia bacterium]|nr:YlxR family protein [Clostridia bacterium]
MKEIRTCIACRQKKNKRELLRIVADNDKAIVDNTYKYNSRAMYICKDIDCINKIKKIKDVGKILKINVTKEEFNKLIFELGEI